MSMKLFLATAVLLFTLNYTEAVALPSYHTPPPSSSISQSYHRGYAIGYHEGKSDQIEKTAKTILAVSLISIGIVVIYNIATTSNVSYQTDMTHYTYKF